MTSPDYIVIGGGVVGLATAWRLQTMQPGSRVCLIEKEPEVGCHQSGHNSGVLHCGLYYKPGSRRPFSLCGVSRRWSTFAGRPASRTRFAANWSCVRRCRAGASAQT
ncbi:MAG: hypothetical protein CM1200mP34_1660 [Verrucomicrobiales bacterium]|nr:MAG: hypothetical protein CM1200mP34_1660 [Verrucomicrobiales bacterium]